MKMGDMRAHRKTVCDTAVHDMPKFFGTVPTGAVILSLRQTLVVAVVGMG